MGTVVYLRGPETREVERNASGPMRQPGKEPAAQRVGEVVARLLQRLTISDTHHRNVNCGQLCGEND